MCVLSWLLCFLVRLGLVAAVLLAWRLRLRWLVPGRSLLFPSARESANSPAIIHIFLEPIHCYRIPFMYIFLLDH